MWKLRIFISALFHKKFVKAMVLLKRQFHELFKLWMIKSFSRNFLVSIFSSWSFSYYFPFRNCRTVLFKTLCLCSQEISATSTSWWKLDVVFALVPQNWGQEVLRISSWGFHEKTHHEDKKLEKELSKVKEPSDIYIAKQKWLILWLFVYLTCGIRTQTSVY